MNNDNYVNELYNTITHHGNKRHYETEVWVHDVVFQHALPCILFQL